MVDRVPLEKPSLTHTSKEPEAQAWAQIGTNLAVEKRQPSTSERDDDANSEVQLHVDEDAEPFQVDDSIDNEPESQDEEGEKQKEEQRESEKQADAAKEKDDKDDDDDDDGDSSTLTNSNNPRHIRSRVFVGHLNTEKCSRKHVEKLFSQYGNVVGCSIQHGYGFVQFENEESARRAIRELHGTHFYGMRIVVDKTVSQKKMEGDDPHAPAPWPLDPQNPRDKDVLEELEYYRRRELYDRYARLEELERYYYDRYQPPVPPRRDPYYDRYYERYAAMDRYYMDRYRLPEYERERYPHDRFERGPSHPLPPYERPRDDPYDRRDLFERREPIDRYGASRRPGEFR